MIRPREFYNRVYSSRYIADERWFALHPHKRYRIRRWELRDCYSEHDTANENEWGWVTFAFPRGGRVVHPYFHPDMLPGRRRNNARRRTLKAHFRRIRRHAEAIAAHRESES